MEKLKTCRKRHKCQSIKDYANNAHVVAGSDANPDLESRYIDLAIKKKHSYIVRIVISMNPEGYVMDDNS